MCKALLKVHESPMRYFQSHCGAQVPNQMNLVVDRPPRHELNRYRQARANEALYRAAARLWAQGIEIGKAVSIVETAMKDAGEL